jgi:hypothetical protein
LLYSNCVGKGNRRWYWLFLLSGAVFCLLYFFCAKYVQYWHDCGADESAAATWVSGCVTGILL